MPTVRTKTAKPEPLVVLNPVRYSALVAALDAAVADDPSLAAARGLLLTPLSLLEALGRDAPGALGDDVLAAERLRLLLALAATHMPPLTAFRDVLGGDPKTGTTVSAVSVPAIPCDDAVVSNGALVVIALAAGRVGKGTGLAEPLVNNVLVTALAAGPAEAVSRAIAWGMGAAQVKALLSGLAHAENGQDRRLSAVIATFLADGCERARWACLEALFRQVRIDVARNVWDAAGSGGIVSVEPRTCCPGDKISIRVEPVQPPPPPDSGPIITVLAIGTPEATLDATHFLPLLARREASVVFASQGFRSVSRLPDDVDLETGTITVTVPANARVGWIGFADPALLELTNRDRTALREQWKERNDSEPALRGAPVPVESIPLLRTPPTPPRSPLARFDGGTPIILDASITPPVVDPGAELRLRWRVQGGRGVHIDPRPGNVANEGEAVVQAPTDSVSAEFTLVGDNTCGDPVTRALQARVRVVIKSVVAEQPERAAPLPLRLVGAGAAAQVKVKFNALSAGAAAQPLVAGEPFVLTATLNAADARGRAELLLGEEVKPMQLEGARATITLPGRYAVDGLTGTVVFRAPDGEIDDRHDFGPLRFVILRSRRLMVIRPALPGRDDVDRVPTVEVEQAIDDARRALGMEIEAGEPAWIDDEELTLASPADGPEVTGTADLLERLHALAARTVGLEDALWVAVVPRPLRKDFLRVEPAEAARAVAVCTPGSLQKLLDAEPPPAEPRVSRLRISGTVDGGGSVRLQPLRVEDRAAGPGPRVESGLRAVALDAQGRVRASRPVRLLTAHRPARLFVLLPITDDVVDLEIRIDDGQPPLPSPDPFGYGAAFGAFFGGGLGGNLLAIRRIHRSEGEPRVDEVEIENGQISFRYNHTRSARAQFVVEAGGSRGWSTVLRLGPCHDSADLPLARLALAEEDRLRVAATDGWNTDLAPDRGIPITNPPAFRVAARHAGELRFWADFDEGGEPSVEWTLTPEDGTPEPPQLRPRGTQVDVPGDFRGTLTLSVTRGTTTVSDTRTISAGGKVDCRRTEHPEDANG
ncbi:MAG TPA: hypothetical protein VFS20_26905 [Longimicrobium sp.]|nr:hypothetical protein [Longimicrobium sp.]